MPIKAVKNIVENMRIPLRSFRGMIRLLWTGLKNKRKIRRKIVVVRQLIPL
jgi:hypothetical protein